MKKTFFFFVLIPILTFSQNTGEIEKLLNKELKKELKQQFQDPNFNGDTLVVIQEFKIDKNILSCQTKHKRYNEEGYYIRKQEVALKDITSISKDVCVLIETNDNVKITDTNYHTDGTKDTNSLLGIFFRTNLCSQKENEDLGHELVKLFKNAGYSITISNWYD
ncbi:hypothetical protein ACEN2I_01625 [Flavobacterium sp. W22_SRS_FK3]|uniref:hypothetical protein n=1 Tax=Flavobacterium sp. W22_SRS_FK3 TaxID=3240275 RepID=UPI003F8F1CAD